MQLCSVLNGNLVSSNPQCVLKLLGVYRGITSLSCNTSQNGTNAMTSMSLASTRTSTKSVSAAKR